MESKQHFYWVDFVRVIGAFLVVMIHVCARLVYQWGKIPDVSWIVNIAYDAAARCAVPLFFMISGYLLLSKTESLKDFFYKRALKVLVPFLAWSLIYTLWYCRNDPSVCRLNPIIRLLLTTGIYYHLWFLYALIGLYLVTPLLRLITTSKQTHILWYFIGLWVVYQPLLSLAKKFWNFEIGISVPMATGYIGYFILGHLLGEWKPSRWMLVLLAVLGTIGVALTAAGTVFLTAQSGTFQDYFLDYLTLNVILASVSAFILLKSLAEQPPFTSAGISRLVEWIGPTCFGIYLVHVIVLEVVSGWIPYIHINASMGDPLWSIPLTTGVIFVLSFLLVKLLQKIPLIKLIVP